MNHYTYKITDPLTDEYYIGVRTSRDCIPEDDDYMGSYYSWVPENKNRLKKKILNKYPTRTLANSFERKILIDKLKIEKDKKCMNAHIPEIGFCTYGNREVARKISESNLGKIFTEEHKKKISGARKKWIRENGHPMEGKCGENHWRYGKGYPEKSKKIMSEKVSGKNNPMYGMTGSLNPFYGKTHTEETKKSISEKVKKAYESIDRVGKNNPASKEVIHIDSGKIFDSITEAGNYFEMSKASVSSHCNGRVKNKKFKFVV